MTLDHVATLAASGESETLECKTTSGGRREAAGTVCAMLNQRGGHVLFGVTPAGDVVGQQVGAAGCRFRLPVAAQRQAGVGGPGRGRMFVWAADPDVRGRAGVMQRIGKRPRPADLPALQPSGGYGSGA